LILSPNSEAVETGLYYNRFRYYNPKTGLYISQDPIRLEGNNPNFYAYVHDSNTMVDVFGLKVKEVPLPPTIDLKPGTEHVLERHVSIGEDWAHKSKWTGNKSVWKTTARDTFKNPDRVIQSGDRFIYEKTYKKPIGLDADGTTYLYKSRVVVEADGKLVTAFPQKEFKELADHEKIMGLEILTYNKKGEKNEIFEINENFHYWLFSKANLNPKEFIEIFKIKDYYKTNAQYSGKDLQIFIQELEKIKNLTPYKDEVKLILTKINGDNIEKIRITGD
jgi:RHS repeat-associated protein